MDNNTVVTMLAALAQHTRLDVFRLLVRAGPEGLAAGEIAARLGLPPATASFHLKELRNAGVLSCERQARSLIYRPQFSHIAALASFLSAECCEGIDQH
jgi:DNA-binding transcriptional ArsR family regulator